MRTIEDIAKNAVAAEGEAWHLLILLRKSVIVYVVKVKGNPQYYMSRSKAIAKMIYDMHEAKSYPEGEVAELELEYILKYKPEYNRFLPNNNKYIAASAFAKNNSISYNKAVNLFKSKEVETINLRGVVYIHKEDQAKLLEATEEEEETDTSIILKLISVLGVIYTINNIPEKEWTKEDKAHLYKSYGAVKSLYKSIPEETILKAQKDGYITLATVTTLLTQRKQMLATGEQDGSTDNPST